MNQDRSTTTLQLRGPLQDRELTELHRRAFRAADTGVIPWNERLERHSIAWVTARSGAQLVGFVNVIGDGGVHAVLLDTVVHPDQQGQGIGRRLVAAAAEEATRLGCHWLHADFEESNTAFYLQGCRLSPTAAGLLRLPH